MKISIIHPSRDVVSDTEVVGTLRRRWWGDRVYRFADVMKGYAKDTCNWIPDDKIVLTFVKRA